MSRFALPALMGLPLALVAVLGCGEDHKVVGPTAAPAVSAPVLPAGPAAAVQGEAGIYTTSGATSSLPDLQYRFDFDAGGAHAYSPWRSDSTAQHSWLAGGTFTVKAQARSAAQTTAISSWSSGLTVVVTPETVSTPDVPTGSTVVSTGDLRPYTTGGAVSTLGHAVEYRFVIHETTILVPDFTTPWSSTASIETTWPAAGSYEVRLQARCSVHPTNTSALSAPLLVTVNPSGSPVVESASLNLVSAYSVEHPLVLRQVTGPWDESSVTWNTMPPLSDSLAPATYSTQCPFFCLKTARFAIDPGLVQKWVDGALTNDGLAVGPGSSTSGDVLFATRNSMPGYRPYFVVKWHYSNESALRSKTVGMTGDTYVDSAQPSSSHGGSYELKAGRTGGDQIILEKFNVSLP